MKSIDRYMARLIALPLFATLLISAMLLVLDRIRRLFEFVATEGGPISVVWRMLANLLPEYLGLGIPIGLMLGILLAFRRLATSSELDVMRGVGMSYTRLLRVPYMYAIVLAALNFAIVGYIQPVARYYYEGLRYELRTGALGASIKVGEFTHLGDRMTLRIEESRDNGRDLSGIFVHANTSKGDWIGVTAARGRFLATDDPNVIIFRLTNGTLIHNRPEFNAARADLLQPRSADRPAQVRQFPPARRPRPGVHPARTGPPRSGRAECRGTRGQPIRIPLPRGRGGDDVPAAAARGVAGHPAEAIDLGTRRIPLDRDARHLFQGEPVCGRYRCAGAGEPDPGAMGPFAVFAGWSCGCIMSPPMCPAASRSAHWARGGEARQGDRPLAARPPP